MNKKLLLLGALMASSVCQDAVFGGFYVGTEIGVGLSQMRVYDNTYHTKGADINRSATQDDVATWTGTYNGKLEVGTNIKTTTNSAREENAGETLVLKVYKPLPVIGLFGGYKYELSGGFFVGIEGSVGFSVGKNKYDGYLKTPDFKWYKVEGEGAAAKMNQKGKFAILHNEITMQTKAFADVSLLGGIVVPGSDGKLSLSVHGGLGWAKRSISFTEKEGENFFYSDVMVNALYQSLKLETRIKGGGVADAAVDCFGWALLDGLISYGLFDYRGVYPFANRFAVTDSQEEFVKGVLGNIETGSNINKSVLLKSEISGSKDANVLTWHVGVGCEYKITPQVFVGLKYTFKTYHDNNKLYAVYESGKLTTPGEADIKTALAELLVHNVEEISVLLNNSGEIINSPSSENIKAYVNGLKFGEPLDIGSLTVKKGTGKNSYEHIMSLRIGFKF